MTSAVVYIFLTGAPVVVSVALRVLELWQVSAVRLILLTPNRNRQFLIRAEAGLD